MKVILIFALVLVSNITWALSWNVEIQDEKTSEVRFFKFSNPGTHKLALDKLKSNVCTLRITDPIAGKEGESNLQGIEILCFHGGGALGMTMACIDGPNEINRFQRIRFQAMDGEPSKEAKKEKNKFYSYRTTVTCE